MGVTERQTLMPQVIIDTFWHALTCRISFEWTNVFIRWHWDIPGTNLGRNPRETGICLVRYGLIRCRTCKFLYKQKNLVIKKKRKKTKQKIETVKYKVLFDHIFSDRNYSKVYKFRRYTITCPSFFNCLLIIFRILIFHWLKCQNLKDELNRFYNGGVVVFLLHSEVFMENA